MEDKVLYFPKLHLNKQPFSLMVERKKNQTQKPNPTINRKERRQSKSMVMRD